MNVFKRRRSSITGRFVDEAAVLADPAGTVTETVEDREPLTAAAPLTYSAFFRSVLNGIGVTPTTANLRALGVVSILEGANSYFNPLNSVIPFGGSKDFNTAHVQKYTTYQNGIGGTIALFKQPRWEWVVAAMRVATSRELILHEFDVEYRTWGSKLDWFKWTPAQAQARLDKVMPS